MYRTASNASLRATLARIDARTSDLRAEAARHEAAGRYRAAEDCRRAVAAYERTRANRIAEFEEDF